MFSEVLASMHLGALFVLGLLGSGHCVSMCGPLVAAIPAQHGGLWAQLSYHTGRITTYGLVGLLMGGLGQLASHGGADSLAWTVRLQLFMSVVAALFLGLFGLLKLGLVREPSWLSLATPARIPGFGRLARRLAAGAGQSSRLPRAALLFVTGLLLGLLPCGLSFAAFARSLATADMVQGGLMTFVFGLGTLPALLLVGLTAAKLSACYRQLADQVAALLMIGMALSLLINLL